MQARLPSDRQPETSASHPPRDPAKLPVLSAPYLAPFAGIAFLWFIGVIRARVGANEDQFFATVFLGSGMLFVAMYWPAAAVLASLVASNRFDAAPPLDARGLENVRSVAFSFLFVLAARAAAVFMIVTRTIAWRTAIFPRPLTIAGYMIALMMLLSLLPAVDRAPVPTVALRGQRVHPDRGDAGRPDDARRDDGGNRQTGGLEHPPAPPRQT